jgi:hypothetical protein
MYKHESRLLPYTTVIIHGRWIKVTQHKVEKGALVKTVTNIGFRERRRILNPREQLSASQE